MTKFIKFKDVNERSYLMPLEAFYLDVSASVSGNTVIRSTYDGDQMMTPKQQSLAVWENAINTANMLNTIVDVDSL